MPHFCLLLLKTSQGFVLSRVVNTGLKVKQIANEVFEGNSAMEHFPSFIQSQYSRDWELANPTEWCTDALLQWRKGLWRDFSHEPQKSTKKKPIPINDQIRSMEHDLPTAMEVSTEPPKTTPDCCTHRTSRGCIQLIFERDSVKPPILHRCVFNSTPHTLKHNLNSLHSGKFSYSDVSFHS